VFYNPIQVFNRDLTILVMQQYINNLREEKKNEKNPFEGVNIADALSASGLRTIRFVKELQGVKKVYANDISEASHKLMKDNFDLNKL
jgi:tRNA (guanine26-N2/guanine27-N2)-dimethyltransferase